MTLSTATPVLELRSVGPASSGEIEGYASTWGGPDLGGDIIQAGAYAKSLAAHGDRKSRPAMLFAHDLKHPIGRWDVLTEDSRGLFVRGVVNMETERGREAHKHIKAGDVTGLSIGYETPPGGATYQGANRVLSQIDLHEISLVTVPMDPRARLTGVKTLTTKQDLEALLHEAGLSRRAASLLAAGGWKALAGADNESEAAATVARIEAAAARWS